MLYLIWIEFILPAENMKVIQPYSVLRRQEKFSSYLFFVLRVPIEQRLIAYWTQKLISYQAWNYCFLPRLSKAQTASNKGTPTCFHFGYCERKMRFM